jgi:PIN domain nuclease of toxin-antitoxin system
LATTGPTIEPAYVVDTMALIWYLKKDKKLSADASVIFAAAEREETNLIVSAISLAELYYANKKWGLFPDFSKVYADLRARSYFSFVAFMPEDVPDFDRDAAIPEMHDRIIAGLARRLTVPLVTSDPLIFSAHTVKVVW